MKDLDAVSPLCFRKNPVKDEWEQLEDLVYYFFECWTHSASGAFSILFILFFILFDYF